MTLRGVSIVFAALAGLATAVPAQAWIIADVIHSIAVDTKRNNCWPKPFVCPDREAVREPFFAMVAKGWQRQNTLGDYHFEGETGKLTEAGELKVRWIVEQAPRHHRTIFVRRADSPEETAARIDLVQQAAIQWVPEGELPPVLETNLDAGSWPADRVDTIDRKFRDTTPDPRLPELTTDTGGSS